MLRTHTLVLRQPFAPFAAPRRLNATDASLDARRTSVVPLLTPSGDVDVLVGGDQSELLVSGDHITVLPAEGTRRYGGNGGSTGLALPGGRALVLGDVRRRLALEDHGPGTVPPPLFLGMERNSLRRRTLAIARRDDGAIGVIVADGSAPETAGVALLERLAGGLRPPERLAPWSSLAGADDPRCKKGSDPLAWEALLVVDPPPGWRSTPPRSPGSPSPTRVSSRSAGAKSASAWRRSTRRRPTKTGEERRRARGAWWRASAERRTGAPRSGPPTFGWIWCVGSREGDLSSLGSAHPRTCGGGKRSEDGCARTEGGEMVLSREKRSSAR